MKEQEKQLLLKDICARLPYEPKARKDGMETSINLTTLDSFYYGDEIILPYLRPMSSMTEEEDMHRCAFLDDVEGGVAEAIPNYIDFLNEHHFDYRGLIGKGLALEAPEGMYDSFQS